MSKPKEKRLPRPDFGLISTLPEGTGWLVTWELRFACHNAIEAANLMGELMMIEQAARGDWRVHVQFTREPERPAEVESEC